jgi:hypothetical protein
MTGPESHIWRVVASTLLSRLSPSETAVHALLTQVSRHSLGRVDQQVETEFQTTLRYDCYNLREQQKRLVHQARMRYTKSQRDSDLQKAHSMPLPACEKLNTFFGRDS